MNKNVFASVMLVAVSVGARADTITLNPVADLRIFSFQPNTNDNFEGLSTLNASGNDQRTLIEFDYSALAGATIQSATLRLRGASFSGSTAPTSTDLYRVIRSWVETTASWNSSDSGISWTNPGGDAVGTTGSQLTDPYYHWTGNQTAAPSWYEFDAAALVSSELTGGLANDGMLLDGASGNSLVYVSREGNSFSGVAGNATDIPQLVVNYTPSPEPASCLTLGAIAGAMLTKRRSQKTRKVS